MAGELPQAQEAHEIASLSGCDLALFSSLCTSSQDGLIYSLDCYELHKAVSKPDLSTTLGQGVSKPSLEKAAEKIF